ncbi:MAG: hypothetical protein ACTHKT_14015 [Solirubrobacterales bacterium]
MSATAAKSKSSRTRKRGTGKGTKSRGSKAKKASAKSKAASAKAANKDGGKRLSPGGLNNLVLGYMKKNRNELPVTAGTVGRGINRSSGAVANCLGRLEKVGEVKLVNKKPREYDLAGENSK